MLKPILAMCLAFSAVVAIAQDKNPTAKVGKYVVELRIPEGGVFAGEEVDIEFRLMDSTKNDEILGMAGIPGAKVVAAISMPAMEGMPVAKPSIHSEGVPGDYGLVAFFPHGGDYQIDLTLTPPGDAPIKTKFMLPVGDERPNKGKPRPLPYELVFQKKLEPKAGLPVEVELQVRDTKDKSVVKAFDIAHTKNFHLLVASKDLVWFQHDHPEMDESGTWHINLTFPAGGDYLIYGDVAPAGKGSFILPNRIHVDGPSPTWKPNWVTALGPSPDGSVKGYFSVPEGAIPVGKMTSVSIKLLDTTTGAAVSDLEPYLGAMGHLMIFSQDGKTVVHSHPKEDSSSKPGIVQFNARFPKPGWYRAFGQFQRAGKVLTVPFTFEVKG